MNAKNALNRKLRRTLRDFTRATLENAFETAKGEIVYVPAAYSSQTCSRCGHIDAKNRNGRDFLCMDCAHVDDGDENAACNIRQRTTEILTLRAAGHNPTKALKPAVEGHPRQRQAFLREECEKRQDTKPRCPGRGEPILGQTTTHTPRGGAGTPSEAPSPGKSGRPTLRLGCCPMRNTPSNNGTKTR